MKKCRNCKTPFEPRFSPLEKVCWDVECKYTEAMEKLRKIKDIEAKNQRKRLNTMKSELMTVQQWVVKAQGVFNKYIRLRDIDKGCISCGTSLQGKKFDAGHFYNANNHWSLRFNEENVHGQCVRCNRDLHGNLLEYRNRIIERIGSTGLNDLEQEANITRKYTRDELISIYTKYKTKCKLNENFSK
jgi:hypothetical protein